MRLRDTMPDLEKESESEFIQKMPMASVFQIIKEVTAYYDLKLSMEWVYNHYGVSVRSGASEEYQVPCLLLSHGGSDFHNSARYYARDRETGENSERVWCFKCQKFLTPFWLFYQRERETRDLGFREILGEIYKYFKIGFPRELLLEFDPALHFQFEDNKNREKLHILRQADKIRSLKELLPREFLGELKSFWRSSYE